MSPTNCLIKIKSQHDPGFYGTQRDYIVLQDRTVNMYANENENGRRLRTSGQMLRLTHIVLASPHSYYLPSCFLAFFSSTIVLPPLSMQRMAIASIMLLVPTPQHTRAP